jgi:hypothetical protein
MKTAGRIDHKKRLPVVGKWIQMKVASRTSHRKVFDGRWENRYNENA